MSRTTTFCPSHSIILPRLILNALILPLICFVWLLPVKTGAAGIFYQFDNEFGTGTPPAGPAPWVTATFQTVSPGTVKLTVQNNGLVGNEFLSGLYFNLNPSFNSTNLSISYVSSVGTFTIPTVGAGTIQLGTDSFKAGGDGKYDMLLNFSTSGPNSFGAGESVTYNISGISGLIANDFAFLSAPDGGHGPYYAAAHVQGIGASSLSGWVYPSLGAQPIVVPEPSSCALLALSLGFLGLRRRVKNRSSH